MTLGTHLRGRTATASLVLLAVVSPPSSPCAGFGVDGGTVTRRDAESGRVSDAPLGDRDDIRDLLTAAGLGDASFVAPESVGAMGAALAWTSGPILGLAVLETRSERSIAELRRGHLETFSSGCVRRPELEGPRARSIAGYTLAQSTIRCQDEAGGRVTVTTSILDDRDVLTLVHVGPDTEAMTLERTNRALGEVLEGLLKP